MKSLLQFFLLIALVLVGKQVKQQSQAAPSQATTPPTVQQHAESIQSFFVQHVSYQHVPAQAVGVEYGRKNNSVTLN
ncbi:hypothetical protein [Hymenobacter jeollabukensis]|uniref:Uncharacterized protein n=1 Tax=Hymenobacter jeollabukensis TaxID=2025313 RepID=A0A5R8WVQ4_9BACT|nr:hypothetical protein [Hymenobacter jeollabukensis]TLM95505.1 hypothetical protein FDY95_06880 [Hymenobacter jeollabukensis]